jgi:hypothetical protein
MNKKYLSIKQWAGKAEKLRIIFNVEPDMMSAEINYNHYFVTGNRGVIYVLYFSHLTVGSRHSSGGDWKEVYEEMFKKLTEHRANKHETAVV